MNPLTERALARRYDVPAPRYTSYPSVSHWDSPLNVAQWLAHLQRALAAPDAAAGLYLHIPFCRSLCTYCGCNTRITRSHSLVAPYLQSLLRELDLYLEALGCSQLKLSELYLGGGTPTFLDPVELQQLLSGLFGRVRLSASTDAALEADPRVTTAEQLAVLAQYGFRRLSLGIEDFDPQVQQIVNRVQSEQQVRTVCEAARAQGFDSVHFDLIFGLPRQTSQSVHLTMDAVSRLRPDRVAWYGYAHVPWIKPGQRHFTEADLPEADERHALSQLGRERLRAAGYHEIGMDLFALESDRLWRAQRAGQLQRQFMGYSAAPARPLIGLGVSAISDAGDAFAQNDKDLQRYQDGIASGRLPLQRGHLLDAEDQVLRRHILRLLTQLATDWERPSDWTAHLQQVPQRLASAQADGLVELTAHGCRVTERGRPFLRSICLAFDARLLRRRSEPGFRTA